MSHIISGSQHFKAFCLLWKSKGGLILVHRPLNSLCRGAVVVVGLQDLHLHSYGPELGSSPPDPLLTTLGGSGTGTQTFPCQPRQILKSCMVPGTRVWLTPDSPTGRCKSRWRQGVRTGPHDHHLVISQGKATLFLRVCSPTHTQKEGESTTSDPPPQAAGIGAELVKLQLMNQPLFAIFDAPLNLRG